MEPPHFSKAKPTCLLSDPARPHKLCRRSDRPLSMCFSCKGKHLEDSKYYYYCAICNLEFHRGCHLFPPEIRHFFHPSHPLTLIFLPPSWSDSSSSEESIYESVEDHGDADGEDDGDASSPDRNNWKCKCCRVPLYNLYYHCCICKFNLNAICSIRPPTLYMTHFKSHEHILTLFPMRLPLPCDACGLSLNNTEDFVYTCLPCSHMVHRSCIYLPRVIQITRHPHRLSFTSALQPGEFSCGVCRQTVDISYGQYSCNKGCHYAVHSKCATREEVWDGKDLEGVPEELDEYIEPPFVRINEETIKHFSHRHELVLDEKKNICEKDKICEACTLPVMISQRFYGCMQCDFVLDEGCASLPRKIYHPLHKHPLTLQLWPHFQKCTIGVGKPAENIFECDGCHRFSCGFRYTCEEEKDCKFRLDTRCASLPDPLSHGCHPHDLFFNLTKGNCTACGSKCSSYYLECNKCKFLLGIRCATLPCEAHYKHDQHPLTLCYGEEDTTGGQYWCEICESKLDPETWFYTCEYCRVTLHVNCLLRQDMYRKPHYIFNVGTPNYQVEFVRNDGNSRPFCRHCWRRCDENLVIKLISRDHRVCSFKCMVRYC